MGAGEVTAGAERGGLLPSLSCPIERTESGRRGWGAARLRAPAIRIAPLVLGFLLAGPAASAAQPETCPVLGPEAITVEIIAPEAGTTVSGAVRVEGRVTSTEPVFRVELFVGDARKDVTTLGPESSFTLLWDSSNRPPGPAPLRVLACGGQPAQGSLVRGAATVEVTVAASEAGPETGGIVVPTDDRADGAGGSPLWVGLVVGVAGLLGLGFASVPARRRSPRPAPAPDPADPPDPPDPP